MSVGRVRGATVWLTTLFACGAPTSGRRVTAVVPCPQGPATSRSDAGVTAGSMRYDAGLEHAQPRPSPPLRGSPCAGVNISAHRSSDIVVFAPVGWTVSTLTPLWAVPGRDEQGFLLAPSTPSAVRIIVRVLVADAPIETGSAMGQFLRYAADTDTWPDPTFDVPPCGPHDAATCLLFDGGADTRAACGVALGRYVVYAHMLGVTRSEFERVGGVPLLHSLAAGTLIMARFMSRSTRAPRSTPTFGAAVARATSW